MPDTYFYADIGRCVGCHACEVACLQEHGDGVKKRIRVEESETLNSYGDVRVDFIPIILDGCRVTNHVRKHGDPPACMTVCPTKALRLDKLEGFSQSLSGGKKISLLRVIET